MSKKNLSLVIASTLFIVLGILFACSVLDVKILNYIIGCGFIVLGVVLLCIALVDDLKLLSTNAFLGVLFMSLGVLPLVNNSFTMLLTTFLIILLTAFGLLIALAGSFSIYKNKKKLLLGILLIVIGVTLFILGMLFYFNVMEQKYFWILAGVAISLVGIYLLTTTIIKLSKKNN